MPQLNKGEACSQALQAAENSLQCRWDVEVEEADYGS